MASATSATSRVRAAAAPSLVVRGLRWLFALALAIGLLSAAALGADGDAAADDASAAASAQAFPATFDLRTSLGESRVSPIVSQGSTEICGAYAAIATLETSLLTGGFAPLQLSPKHAAYFEATGFEENEARFGRTDGNWSAEGIAGMAPAEVAASLAAGKGAVLLTPETDGDLAFDESWRTRRDVTLTETTLLSRLTTLDDGNREPVGSPAPAFALAAVTDDASTESVPSPSALTIRDMPTFWEVTGVDDDREAAVKSLLMEGHAVTVVINAGDFQASDGGVVSPLNWETCSFYTPVDATGSGEGHYLAIVGWDDGYARENFTLQPPHDGAWLVKNSWGTDYPQGGFFWVSYDEGLIAFESSLSGEPTREGEAIYQKDTAGWMNSMAADPAGPSSTGYMANVFTAERDERLDRVMLAATGKNTAYEVAVYHGLGDPDEPTSGTLVATARGTKAYPGYVTATLDRPVALAEGDVFSVVAKVTTPTFGYPIPVEVEYVFGDQDRVERPRYIGYDPATRWQTREVSWVSSDGVHWRDPFGNGQPLSYAEHSFVTNVTLKAITVPDEGDEPDPGMSVGVSRLYNAALGGAHLLTADANEVATLAPLGWVDEGVGFIELGREVARSAPVYRLFNPHNGDHFFTASNDEAAALAAVGWIREGVAWYAPATGAPVYRLYNPNQTALGGLGNHLWTTSEPERDHLVSLGWQLEGPAWPAL